MKPLKPLAETRVLSEPTKASVAQLVRLSNANLLAAYRSIQGARHRMVWGSYDRYNQQTINGYERRLQAMREEIGARNLEEPAALNPAGGQGLD